MSKPSDDQGTLFSSPTEGPDAAHVDVPPDVAAEEGSCYDPAEPADTIPPYRGPWKDSSGMCSPTCPAIRQVPGFSRPYTDCLVTGYRVEPTKWPCEVRSVYEAVKRGPGP